MSSVCCENKDWLWVQNQNNCQILWVYSYNTKTTVSNACRFPGFEISSLWSLLVTDHAATSSGHQYHAKTWTSSTRHFESPENLKEKYWRNFSLDWKVYYTFFLILTVVITGRAYLLFRLKGLISKFWRKVCGRRKFLRIWNQTRGNRFKTWSKLEVQKHFGVVKIIWGVKIIRV